MKIKEYHGMNILIIHFSKYHFLGYEDDDDNNEIENYNKYVIIEEAYNKMEVIRKKFEEEFRKAVRLDRSKRNDYFKNQKLEDFEKPIEDFQKKLKEYYQ